MAKIASGKIERIAVAAIKAETLNPASHLVANIQENDKGISFDGDIQVFKNAMETVDSLAGIVPIQVKGNQVKEFSKGKRTYGGLSLGHFENYYDREGVLLLVVEMKDTNETKIFYKQLLTKELSSIISKLTAKMGKSRNVELRALEETSLFAVCCRFLEEKKLQPRVLVENNPFVPTSFTSYQLSSLTFNPGHIATSNIFDHDFMVYGVINELKVPLDQIRFNEAAQKGLNNITIDEAVYEIEIEIVYRPNEVIVIFEDAFQFSFSFDQSKKEDVSQSTLSFKFIKFHSLATQLKIMPIVEEMLSGKLITIQEFSFSINENEFLEFQDEIQKTHAVYRELFRVFEEIQVSEQSIFVEKPKKIKNGMQLSLFREFKCLIKAVLHNDLQDMTLNNPDSPSLLHFHLGESFVVFYYDPFAEKKLANAFSGEVLNKKLVVRDGKGNECQHSFYLMLEEESLTKGININHAVIRSSFDMIDPFINELASAQSNAFCLKCINAFDQTGNIELLETAEYIFRKSNMQEESEISVNSVAHKINLIQIQIRKQNNNVLSSEHSDALILMKRKIAYADQPELHFCANVLLGNKAEADFTFKEFQLDKQKFYQTLPIYHLYTQLQ